ncbi:D-3-phosphoglycerate dehydrogenase [Flexibacter flexilis DSM 6793]|uniref:D-3-phosphoglycerate dehydrogenase n=1 Tax=Flexibacter flexilis DSM 6793 TaxID=927664 RepID=A0A1I1FY88_9BACT|nr:NAD(P)-dependent oxidoreductase [Flexibacter flexilis]SFC04427.1 D-3-phosphoglycerate dehydrogenase [Flexibacter flexilis DSM 6793]
MRCLIIDDMHPSISQMLLDIEITPNYRPDIKREEILDIIADYQGLIVRSKTPINAEILAKASQLQFIGRAGAGLDNIDLEAVKAANIRLFHAAEGNRDAVGEHAVGLMLCLLNKLHTSDRQVRQKQWLREYNRGYELGSLTVGIIGYGNMGRATARKLSGFGCRVLAYDKYLTQWPDTHAQQVSLQTLQQETDLLSLHIPLTAETKGMVNESFINAFHKNIWLVNTARGEIVPLQELEKTLETGKVRGAALDVLENEKLASLSPSQIETFDRLAQRENVVFSPHVAGWTFESYQRINEVLVKQLASFVKENI